ncbi:Beta-lactamase superfamily domain-containing protein [Algoriphagus hitonicola]|uniref:Beta-lactamase superfamily domain-containing protein n=2 Tax=Algoriphagus hitonicola TaxID=435880 RepID=A0A1I2Q4U2_9BACT|nr:Beta-lactamase superfamily domain-containing protein [Algoriphagus hitonicola]
MKLSYGGQTFLIDPYFAEVFSEPSFGGNSKNPTSALPSSIDEIIEQVDYLFISHLHPDHFDSLAQQKLQKEIPVLCQPEDYHSILEMGFIHVIPLEEKINLGDTSIQKISGKHGFGKIADLMGPVSGLVFQNESEKTLYWLGDTIFEQNVKNTIDRFSPEILVCHAGGNKFFKSYDFLNLGLKEDTQPLIMDGVQLAELTQYTPESQIIVTHIDALDHETETRSSLLKMIEEKGINESRVYIPENGTILIF